MAFDVKQVYGYGNGALGDVTNPTGQLNSYANVTTYTATTITIGAAANGVYEKFAAGAEIMLHVSATNGTSKEFTYLGKYMVCRILSLAGAVLTIDKDFTQVVPATEYAKYQIQAITIAQFKSLTLSSGAVAPPVYNITTKYGGICLFKCSDTFALNGGSINLIDKGIPVVNAAAYRPLTTQEQKGNADTDQYSGWENHITAREFLLNSGDGAVGFWTKRYSGSGTTSRIGGTAAGTQFLRGTTGGSSILWIADTIDGFNPSVISKVKGSGAGLGRCYIASKTKLRNDEGLYAYDTISDPLRLMRTLNIKNFGDGSLGDVS